jgi:hypothetical protein
LERGGGLACPIKLITPYVDFDLSPLTWIGPENPAELHSTLIGEAKVVIFVFDLLISVCAKCSVTPARQMG